MKVALVMLMSDFGNFQDGKVLSQCSSRWRRPGGESLSRGQGSQGLMMKSHPGPEASVKTEGRASESCGRGDRLEVWGEWRAWGGWRNGAPSPMTCEPLPPGCS